MWLAAFLVIAGTAPAFCESVTLLRVFLNDGTAIVSYGEYARVGDRLVFSMPVGSVDPADGANPLLHVVNLPVSAVNWTATERYAASARYTSYIANNAESDYAALAGEVAATLNAIVINDAARARLSMAVDARKRLASWPKDHYGYRADDVREMLGMLDEAIAGLRAAAGETSFSIDLVADTPPEPQRDIVPMLRAPTPAEAIAQAISVAKATDVPADRVSILRTVIAAIDDRRNVVPAGWAGSTRKWAIHAIDAELDVNKEYAAMSSTLRKRASAAADRADVRGVQGVLAAVIRRDAQLGRRRPDEINALIEQVRAHLDAARRLRLARDRWEERSGSFRAYMNAVAPVLESMKQAHRTLDDIKALAGSDAEALVSWDHRLTAHAKMLNTMAVPEELKPAHALLCTAVNFAGTALKTRRQAAMSGELQLAWDASSAASGSMMLLARAQDDLRAAVRVPEIR